MAVFRWTGKRVLAAQLLAEGYNQQEVCQDVGVSDRTIRRWVADIEFSQEVDRLTHMFGLATRAERLRLAKRVIRERLKLTTIPPSKKDLLDWLKYFQSETDGIKLDLTAFLDDALALAGGGSTGVDQAA